MLMCDANALPVRNVFKFLAFLTNTKTFVVVIVSVVVVVVVVLVVVVAMVKDMTMSNA